MVEKKSSIVWNIITLLLLLLFIPRLFYSMHLSDEIFNLGIAWRNVVGQSTLIYDNTTFQTGDMFAVPYLALYYFITGSSEGIVLFSRFCFLFQRLLLGALFYHTICKEFERIEAKMLSLYSALYLFFYLINFNYDTFALDFWFAGCLLILMSFQKESWKKWILGICAGVCHGCMVYAYPTLLLVVLSLVIIVPIYLKKCGRDKKDTRVNLASYAVGGIMVCMVFLLYVSVVGKENIYLLQADTIKSSLSGRTLSVPDEVEEPPVVEETPAVEEIEAISDTEPPLSAAVPENEPGLWERFSNSAFYGLLSKVLTKIMDIFTIGMRPLFHVLIPTIALLLLSCIRAFREKYAWLLPFGIVVTGMFVAWNDTFYSGLYFSFYLFIWAPIIYLMLCDEYRKKINIYMIFLWLPCLIGGLAICLTALYGHLKVFEGMRCGELVFMMNALLLIKQQTENKSISKFNIPKIFLVASISVLLVMWYTHGYWNEKPSQCTYYMESGIGKGIYSIPEQETAVVQQELLNSCLIEEDTGIVVFGNLRYYLYLASDLKPYTPQLYWPRCDSAGVFQWEAMVDYWNTKTGYPDIIFLTPDVNLDLQSADMTGTLSENYDMIAYEEGYGTVYRMKK